MALQDWDVIDAHAATRRVNGREIVVQLGPHASIYAAIAVWEAQEQQRMQARLLDLGGIVDSALERLRGRYSR